MKAEWKLLKNFLGGTFHQDIDSPEQALIEYISSVDREWIQTIINTTTNFLESELSVEEKNNFIQDNVEIYFPTIELSPIEWLKSVVIELKRSLGEV